MISALAALALLTAAPQQAADPTIAAGLVVDQMHQAASRADGPAYFDTFTPDARFIGTDATERWTLSEFRAYATPYFSQGKGWTYRPHDRMATLAPGECRCIVWFDELLDNDAYGLVRGSGVVRLTEAGWKIEQYVLSLPVPNDKAKAVVALIAAAPAD
ncbi:nuclear transport factor 2 family protein [Brevundimonas sp.]|uniref:nuclear transport factor 2 family protein n=1 Tax=Brevundimonas sp. TaxID=1871086 RepID=UPI0025C04818|nr:nuclear transport factor 2 family protein [Brevundimonas sp.]